MDWRTVSLEKDDDMQMCRLTVCSVGEHIPIGRFCAARARGVTSTELRVSRMMVASWCCWCAYKGQRLRVGFTAGKRHCWRAADDSSGTWSTQRYGSEAQKNIPRRPHDGPPAGGLRLYLSLSVPARVTAHLTPASNQSCVITHTNHRERVPRTWMSHTAAKWP